MPQDARNPCRNCSAELASGQAYCASCGQKRITTRLTMPELGHDLLHVVFHVDRSVLSLIRALLVRPGAVALDYVQGRRKRYSGPFAFLFIVVAAASAMVAFTGFRAVVSGNPTHIADILQRHINLIMFVQVPVLAMFSRLLDTRGAFNFAEHLVLAAYTSGMRVLVFTLILLPAWYLFHPRVATTVNVYYAYLTIWPMYFGLAASRFFSGNRVFSWCKGVLAAILTWALAQAVVIAILTSPLFQSIGRK
jgi:hypothetical protein